VSLRKVQKQDNIWKNLFFCKRFYIGQGNETYKCNVRDVKKDQCYTVCAKYIDVSKKSCIKCITVSMEILPRDFICIITIFI
jgi:hypothetical protein